MDDPDPPTGLIGAYRLQSRLGRGASADVWRAVRADGRGAPVAIKLMRAGLSDSARRQRAAEQIEHEGNILAALRHPNIAALRDAGSTATGQAFLVLELVDGEPIDAHCRRLRLGIEARLRLSLKVLRAVAHAHQHLVVHGDIKPANVMVDRSGEVKLLDFGVARRLETPTPTDPSVATPTGDRTTGVTAPATALSPRHAAPELLDRGEWSTASDVYALGVLMYELLSGRHPTARTGAGEAEQLHAALHLDPAPVSAWAARRTATEVDPAALAAERGTTRRGLARRLAGDLDRLLAKMLSKSPGDRYPTVDAVCDDVERHLSHQPISVRPANWHYSAAKFLRRYRAAAAASALVSIAVAAGAVGTLSQAATARRETAEARHEQAVAQARLRESEASIALAKGILCDALSDPRPPLETLENAVSWVNNRHAGDPGVRARLLERLGDSMIELDQIDRGRALYEQSAAAARQAGDAGMEALARCSQATVAARTLDAAKASALYGPALQRLRDEARSGDEDDRIALARCLTAASTAESLHGNDPDKARQFGEEAVRIASGLSGGGRSTLHHARLAAASALVEGGRWAAAEAIQGELVSELEAAGREQSLVNIATVNLRADSLMRGGQKRRALELLNRAAAIEHNVTGGQPMRAVELNNLGALMVDVGDFDAAGRAMDDALAAASRAKEGSLVGIIQLNRARLHCELNDAVGCRRLLEQGLKALEPLVPPGHPRRSNLASMRATVALTEGNLKEADRQLREAVALQHKATGKPSPGLLARLARVQVATGQLDAAEKNAQDATAAARQSLGGFAHSESLGMALLALADVRHARGEPVAARALDLAARENLLDALGPNASATRAVSRRLAGSTAW